MSESNGGFTVKMDVDMSGFDKKIDTMNNRLNRLKKDIEAVGSSITSQLAASLKIKGAAQTIKNKISGNLSDKIGTDSAKNFAALSSLAEGKALAVENKKVTAKTITTSSDAEKDMGKFLEKVENIIKRQATMISR